MMKYSKRLNLFILVVGFLHVIEAVGFSAPLVEPPLHHEQAPQDRWLPKTREASAPSAKCGPVVRNGYKSIQVNVDSHGCNIVGDAANEPSIVIHPAERRKIAIGWRQFNAVTSDFREAGWAYSHDGGHSWVAGLAYPGRFGSDPVLASDTDGTFYYLSLDRNELRLLRSFDAGLSWATPIHVTDYFYDKPWLIVDTSDSIARNTIYITGSGALMRSRDRGESFEEITFDVAGHTLATNTAGDLFVAIGAVLVQLQISKDIQHPAVPTFSPKNLTFGFHPPVEGGPNGEGHLSQAWVATDRSAGSKRDNVYLLTVASLDPLGWDYDFADIVFSRSTDGGESWSRPLPVNDDPPSMNSWQWFNTMSVAPNGRIDVVWNDTRNSLQPNLSELFYSYSNDSGNTWSQNVPVSPMFDSWIGRPAGSFNQKLGDYYHMVSDNLGVNVAYAATFNGEQDIYFLRIGPWDCNGNEIDDAVDIASAPGSDCNANEVPDECEYRVDVDGDGLTTLSDHAALIPKLSGPAGATPIGCDRLFDADHDGHIDLSDFAYLQRVLVAP